MKKIILGILMGMVLMTTSCQKENVDEWTRFTTFVKEDLIGHYEANPDETYYEDYPVQDMTVHRNATVNIRNYSGNLIEVQVVIPELLNQTFTGTPNVEGYNSNLLMHNTSCDLILDVYKNDKNQIRLHGSVIEMVGESKIIKVFDVVK